MSGGTHERRLTSLRAAQFLRAAQGRGAAPAQLTPEALAAFTAYSWPGNVRELENVIERLALSARGGTIDLDDLPATLREPARALEQGLFEDLPSLDEMQKRYLKHVLAVLKGNRSRAAEVLGIDRRTLYRMAERFGLDLAETGDE